MKRIVIAGGGTGGHVYPALSIAQAMKQIDSNVQIDFVGTELGFEAKIIPPTGFPLHFLKVGKLNLSGGLVEKLKTVCMLPISLIQALGLYFRLRPDFVLGVGGYASGPFVLISSLFRTPSAVWEPNAYPGLTNRILAHFVKLSFIVFDEAKKILKSREVIHVGLPVRAEIEQLGEQVTATANPQFHILVFGGSQGARAMNKAVFEYLKKYQHELAGIEVTHQTGKLDFAEYQEKYRGMSFVQVLEYLNPMVDFYKKADMIICRSGASSVAEVAAIGKPAIFIPLPTAADNHQVKNAETLVEKGAAFMIEQKNLSSEELRDLVLKIKSDAGLRREISSKLRQIHVKNAATLTARKILERMS